MSRRAFQPTARERENVEVLVGYGIPETEICRLVKNPETGKPIDAKTLRKHFKPEIATGAAKAKSLVANFIVSSILGKEGGIKDERARAMLAMFFAKCRMGWSEKSLHEHSGTIELEVKYAEDDLDRKLNRLLAASAEARVSSEPE